MSRLTLFAASAAPEEHAAPARIVRGEPLTRFRVVATHADGRVSAGTWSAEPGAWRVQYDEWEFCHVVAGRARLTEDGGAAIEVQAGDAFVLAPGYQSVWDVLEPMTKHFVIIDPPAQADSSSFTAR